MRDSGPFLQGLLLAALRVVRRERETEEALLTPGAHLRADIEERLCLHLAGSDHTDETALLDDIQRAHDPGSGRNVDGRSKPIDDLHQAESCALLLHRLGAGNAHEDGREGYNESGETTHHGTR